MTWTTSLGATFGRTLAVRAPRPVGSRIRLRPRTYARRGRGARGARPRGRGRDRARRAGRACRERGGEPVTGVSRVRADSVPVAAHRRTALRRQTTKLTSLPGTTIVFRGSPPFRCARTRSDARASATSSASADDGRRPAAGRAPCRSPARRARTSRARASPRRRPATAAATAARARAAPELLGHVRRVRLDQRDGRLGREPSIRRRYGPARARSRAPSRPRSRC